MQTMSSHYLWSHCELQTATSMSSGQHFSSYKETNEGQNKNDGGVAFNSECSCVSDIIMNNKDTRWKQRRWISLTTERKHGHDKAEKEKCEWGGRF